jgi:hypothetical protein
MMPTLVQYDRAMTKWSLRGQIPDPRLRDGRVVTVGALQKPWKASGQFAVVYKFTDVANQPVAFRCFLSEGTIPVDAQAHFDGMMRTFGRAGIERWTVGMAWHDPGIEVPIDGTTKLCPILEMQWIAGQEIHEWVRDRLRAREGTAVAQLYDQWNVLATRMREAGVAHCDLSARNVLVQEDGTPVLVDYDEVYAEELGPPGRSTVAGTPGFQHPSVFGHRGQATRTWDERADDFSVLLIATALRAACVRPDAWERATAAGDGDHLLFTPEDLSDPTASALFADLGATQDAELKRLVDTLEGACTGPLAQVPAIFARPEPSALKAIKHALLLGDDRQIGRLVREHCLELLQDGRVSEGQWRQIGAARRREQARASLKAPSLDEAAWVQAWLRYGALPNGPVSWPADDSRLTDLLDRLGAASVTAGP